MTLTDDIAEAEQRALAAVRVAMLNHILPQGGGFCDCGAAWECSYVRTALARYATVCGLAGRWRTAEMWRNGGAMIDERMYRAELARLMEGCR